jgi:acetolactate synthase-1/2/3 large subunit
MRCGSNEDLAKCLKWLYETDGYVMLEIEQAEEDPVTPKVMSRMRPDGTFITPSIEDMSPFISKEEHDSLMLRN